MRWDDKRHGRDERAGGMRERSRSREREQRDWRGDCPQRCSSSGRHSDSVGQGRVHRSDDRDNEYRQWLTAPPPPPPPPPPRLHEFGAMPRMSAPQGGATSSNALPNARALNPRQLTSCLGKVRDLPELLALHQRHSDHFNHFHIGAFWSKFKALACGELGGLSDRLQPVCEQTVRMLPELDARAVANLAHAFAKAGIVGAGPWQILWAALPEAVRWRLGGFTEQNLSNTAWAFATVGHASPELLNAISAEAVRWRLGGFDSQQLSNLAWAFAVFNPLSADELFSPPSFVTRCALLEATFSHSSLAQLHQWSLWREERGAPWPELPRALRHACRDAFISQGEKPSRLQAEVVQEIRSHDARVKEEHRCEASGYSIDALVTLKTGEQIAVEVDGPSHFLGRSHQPTGASLLKHRQLRHFCRRLESVSYWDWDRSKELHWLPQREEKR